MRAFKSILLVAGVALLAVDVGWRVWVWHYYAGYRALATQFRLESLHTNDASGIGIFYAKTEQPLWVKWDFLDAKKSTLETYYFQGHDVFDVSSSSNHPPRYSATIIGAGKSQVWWLDRGGSGSFTERVFYDTNAILSKQEVWYDNKCQLVDRRNGKNGIVISGQWRQLAFDTTGGWITSFPTNRF
jgi:hypothetical protein